MCHLGTRASGGTRQKPAPLGRTTSTDLPLDHTQHISRVLTQFISWARPRMGTTLCDLSLDAISSLSASLSLKQIHSLSQTCKSLRHAVSHNDALWSHRFADTFSGWQAVDVRSGQWARLYRQAHDLSHQVLCAWWRSE